jgi:hypothetical protein
VRPAWLTGTAADLVDVPATAPAVVVHIDGSGVHGTLFERSERATKALDHIRGILSETNGVVIEHMPPSEGNTVGFKAQFNTVMVTPPTKRHLLSLIENALGAHGFEVSATNWVDREPEKPAAPAAPAPAPAPPATVLAAPASSATSCVIEVPSKEWTRLDMNQRARIKRALRKAQIGYDEGVDSITSKPVAKSSAGLMQVMNVLKELSIVVEPRAA